MKLFSEDMPILREGMSEQTIFEDHEIVLKDLTHRVLRQEPLSEIMDSLCTSLVETLGYTSACIGIKIADGRILFPHRAGVGANLLPQVKIRWDNTSEGRGAMGEALRRGKAQTNRVLGQSQFEPWQDVYHKLGLSAMAAIPLLEGLSSYGVLGLYSADEACFTAQRMSFLEHFGNEISLAITAAKNREQLEYYQLLADESQEIIFFVDENCRIVEANHMTVVTYGYSRKELLGMDVMLLRAPRAKGDFFPSLSEVVDKRLVYETVNVQRDGTEFPVEVTVTTSRLQGNLVLMVINRDITQRKTMQELLQASETRYREILQNMSNAVAVMETHDEGENFVVLDVNRAAEMFEHLDREDILGMNLREIYPQPDAAKFHATVREVWETGKSCHMKIFMTENGRIWSRRELDLYRLPTGEVVGIYQDVTREKLAEEALWLEKERAHVTLSSVGDAVLTVGMSRKIKYMNLVAEDMMGWKLTEARGLFLDQILHLTTEEGEDIWNHPVVRCLREGERVQEDTDLVLWQRSGAQFTVEVSASPLRDEPGNLMGAVLIMRNVTQQRELLQQMMHQANHDALTDLPNRSLFQDRIQQAILKAQRHKEQVAVFFLDLDDFKLVNDTYGHAAGDSLLNQVAERFITSLRQDDTVARQGGDEFLILLPELPSEQQAAQVAQKLLDALKAPFQLREQETYITASLGIALYPIDGENSEILIQHADMAMYQAKAEGRNRYHFYTLALNERLSERLALQNEMRRAIERQEFVLYYQPQYRLSDGRICGMEALIRWQHPERGVLLPGKFIAIAEESGLILPLGEWVLRTACSQNKQWQDLGYQPLPVAINLSARQFRQKDLDRQIAEILEETGLESKWLELEITESLSMENVDLSVETLQKLKRMGIHISIDDFGTGFSSLSFLSRFPLNTIKIDRSFISELNHHTDGQAIVLTIIQLAQNLGLKVIAEGVETEAQLDFLRTKGCDEVQGFLLARPVPGEELVAYLEKKG